MGEKSVDRNCFIKITNCFKKADFSISEPSEIENEVNENELIELM